MNNFEKEAQKRSVTKMLGRAINPIEWIRQMSSSKYRRMSAAVDAIDKVMRDNILQLQPELKNYLHQARMAMKNREFLKVFQYSNYIVDAVNGVFANQTDELEALGREIYFEFSQDKMDEFERQQLEEELGVRKPRVASTEPELLVEAAITQWLQEKIPTRKEIEGTLFDKIFRNMQGKQQEAARQALTIAERTYDFIKIAFDTLDNERRNIIEYVRLARDYQKRLGIEKDKLKKMYLNHFSAQTAESQQTNVPESITPPQPQITPSPTPQTIPTLSPTANPIIPVDEPLPKEVKQSVLDLVERAKTAAKNGDMGIRSALLAKASEICDNYGDENRSITFLKMAADPDYIRGRTVDCCIFDEVQDIPDIAIGSVKNLLAKAVLSSPVSTYSKDRVTQAFMHGFCGTPKKKG